MRNAAAPKCSMASFSLCGDELITVTFIPKALPNITAMPEPTKPDNTKVFPRLIEPKLLHGTVHCDTCTEQRCSFVHWQVFRELDHELLIDNNPIGLASVGHCAILVEGILGECNLGAVILEVLVAVLRRLAGVNHASNSNLVTNFEFVYIAPNFGDNTNNFMPAKVTRL